jgi:hypothetical protein
MARCFQDLCREELEEGGGLGLAALWTNILREVLYTAFKERSAMLARNTYRSVVGVALATAFILLIPLLGAPAWSLADFVVAGVLIFGTDLTYVLVARQAGNKTVTLGSTRVTGTAPDAPAPESCLARFPVPCVGSMPRRA